MDWDIQDVCQWLKNIGLGEHVSMFEEHLLDFGKDDLKELARSEETGTPENIHFQA